MRALEARLRLPLELIVSRSTERRLWVGTREHGVRPNTVEALERRGLVECQLERRGARSVGRLVCRPTDAGRELGLELIARRSGVNA